jgi:predicted outer membrane repeat protein
VSAGDTVQFRFDFGKDACNGDEDWYAQGWYIDAFEVLACDPFLASGSAKMYWADRDTGKVQRADLDGSNVEDLVTGLVEPTDTTIDATSGKLYWSERISDKIRRANLDGTDVEDVIASGQESPLGLQVDPSAGKIYWLDGTVRIRRADLDGSNIETLISGLNFVTGLALDVGGGKMYYANQNAGLRTEILRANLDGTGQETLVTWPTASGGARIALDLVNDKAYWADQVTDEIQRSDLDGSNIVLIYDATGASTMTGIAVDPAGGKVYWTDSDQDAIRRANLDGSGVEDLIIGGGLLKPGGITVGTGTFTEPVGPILYVDAAATGNHDGSSWTHAFRYLQDALTASAASGGDVTEIWVAAGTYRPDRGLGLVPGDRSATFELQSGVTIYGGFASVLSLPDPSERDELSDRAPLVHASVLSGDLSGDDDAADFPNGATFADNSYHVVTFEGMASAGLDGFTVTAGNADGEVAPTNFGGGLVSSFGTPTIANCTFRQNHASYGSAVFVASSDPTLIDCRFESNTATWDGGAIYVGGTANPTLTRCVFSGNTARNGGAIANEADGSLTAVSCVFAGNQTSAGGGGAVLVSASDATLVNCELSGNRAGNGGAMVITNASTATISSCTLADNTAALTGGAVAVYSSAVTMSSCILWGNMDGGGGDESAQIHLHGTATASVDYSLLQGLTGALGGSGNIDGDPRFVDAAAGDLQLRSGSPAIDAGDTTALPADDADVDTDGNPFERLPLDLAGVVRLIDDPDTSNTGLPAAGVCTDPPRVGLGCATDADCEPGICDLGGTAPTVVDMGAFEFYPDCNDNDVPDICDLDCFAFGGDCAIMLSCGTSVDLNEDGRPDECASASSGGAWSDDIWGLGGSYPDDDAGVSGVHVLLDGATSAAASLLTDVLLDVPAKISSLTLRNDATLKMIESATAADLEVVDGGVDNEGAMLLGFDRVMDLTAGSEPQPLKVGPGGMIRKDPTVTDYSSASIRTGDVILHAGGCGTSGCKNGGIVELTDSMFLSVQGDLTLDGAVAVSATAVAGGAFAPPFLRLVPATAGAGGIAAALLTVPSVTVTGKMSILRYSQVTNESPGGVLLHGDFENKSVAPSMFDWTGGALTMTPAPAEPPFNGAALLITSAPQRFEVAGLDLGPVADGFATDADTLFDSDPHTNFTIEALTIGEPSTVAGTGTCQVSFVNEFANTAALGPCQEAAYFRECTFNAGCSVILEDVNVYCGSIQDLGADIVESGCGTLQIVALAPDPFGGCANDFELASNGAGGERLSRFGCVATPQPPAAAGGGGSAIRVVFRTLYNTAGGDPDGASVCAPRSLLPSPPPSLSQFEGQTRWLGAPVEIVDEAAPTPPNYIGAPLACTAAGAGVRDWSPAGLAATFGVDADTSRIFFYDSGVVPCSVYEVSHCSDAMNEATCSDPVLVFTSRMADAWPPFEVVGQPSFTDINAVVGKYKGIPFAPGNPPLGGAPEWHAFQKGNVVGDYNLSVVNKKVGFLDIGVAVDGYKGIPYKEPGPCNPATGLDNCGNACSTAP